MRVLMRWCLLSLSANRKMHMQNKTVYSSKDKFSSVLHALRGLAALSVVFYHAALMQPAFDLGTLSIVNQFGAGVTLFFLLSGLSLALSTHGRVERPGWLQSYFLRRLARILPVWWFFLLVHLAYQYTVFGVTHSGSAVLLNAVPVFGLIPGLHTSIVWAGWTIGVEVLFYIAFPIVLALLGVSARRWVAFLVLTIAVSVAWNKDAPANLDASYRYMSIVNQFFIFVAGAASFFLVKVARETSRELFLALTSSAVGLFCLFWWCLWVYGVSWAEPGHFATVAKTGALLGLVVPMYLLRPNGLSRPFLAFLGDHSYTIYLAHPIVVYQTKVLYPHILSVIGVLELAFLVYSAVVILVTCVAAFLVTRLIEVPLYAYGSAMASKIEKGQSVSAVR